MIADTLPPSCGSRFPHRPRRRRGRSYSPPLPPSKDEGPSGNRNPRIRGHLLPLHAGPPGPTPRASAGPGGRGWSPSTGMGAPIRIRMVPFRTGHPDLGSTCRLPHPHRHHRHAHLEGQDEGPLLEALQPSRGRPGPPSGNMITVTFSSRIRRPASSREPTAAERSCRLMEMWPQVFHALPKTGMRPSSSFATKRVVHRKVCRQGEDVEEGLMVGHQDLGGPSGSRFSSPSNSTRVPAAQRIAPGPSPGSPVADPHHPLRTEEGAQRHSTTHPEGGQGAHHVDPDRSNHPFSLK